jgi:branched-subunit amino acid aminotransferase/4-amino-4-deoxychorismate lyase
MAAEAAPSFDDRDGSIRYDGKLVPWRSANLHVSSHALHACCMFEGERVYGGEVFKLAEQTLVQTNEATNATIKANNIVVCTFAKHKAEQAGYDDALDRRRCQGVPAC